MFSNIPPSVLNRLRALEKIDQVNPKFTKQVPQETRRFLAILAASGLAGTLFELGTSCGYSALWISLACRLRGTRLVTVDHDPEKVKVAKETFAQAQVQDIVTVIHGDSKDQLLRHNDLGFCFIDAGGGIGTYDIVVPRLKDGGLLVYDNIMSHEERARPTVEKALSDDRVGYTGLPLPSGREEDGKLTGGVDCLGQIRTLPVSPHATYHGSLGGRGVPRSPSS